MNRHSTSAVADVSVLIGALELSDTAFFHRDAALEQVTIAGPSGPTSILANCYATKSALCPRIDDGVLLARD